MTFLHKTKQEGIRFHQGMEGYTKFYTGNLSGMAPHYFSVVLPECHNTMRVSQDEVSELLQQLEEAPEWVLAE